MAARAAELMENVFLPDVAKEITIDWKNLGRKLMIPEAQLESIDSENPKIEEKACQTLLKWYRNLGHPKATKEVVFNALRAIGRTSTVVELEHHDETHEETCESQDDNNNVPRQETSTATKDTTPLPNTTSNDPMAKILRALQKELSSTLKNCQHGIEKCSSAELVGRQRILGNVHNMYRTVNDMIAHYEASNQDATKMAFIDTLKFNQREKIQHVDQTILLIKSMLEQPQKVRTTSELPKRCTSFIDLQVLNRSSTCPEWSRPLISGPIVTTQSRVVEQDEGPECSQHKHNNEKITSQLNTTQSRVVEQDDGTEERSQHNRSNLEITSQPNVVKQDNSPGCSQHRHSGNVGTTSPTNATQSPVVEQDDGTECSRHNRNNLERTSPVSATQTSIKERDGDKNNEETLKNAGCEETKTHEDPADKEVQNSKL